jgi:hypothetical protein
MKKTLKRIVLILIIVFVGIQFIPTKLNESKEVYEKDFINTYEVPLEISKKLEISCYDCHSNNTNYPWYNKIQPIPWFLEEHINEGKSELNFNEFGDYSERKQKSKLTSIIRQIEGDKMPLSSYLIMHKKAEISSSEKEKIVLFLNKKKEKLSKR